MLKKVSYKTIAAVIFVISIISLLICKSAPIGEYWQSIIVSLAINLVSSVVIIYLIDIKKEKDASEELKRKRTFIYKKLVLPINRYNYLLISMYKAITSKKNFNLSIFDYNSKDYLKIFKNMNNLDLDKAGYVHDPLSNKDYSWKEIIIKEWHKYVKDIEQFYNSNSYLLDNDLSEKICAIVAYKENEMMAYQFLELDLCFEENSILFDMLGLIDIYRLTNDIQKIIADYVESNSFEIDDNFIKNDDSTHFESGLKEFG